LSFLGKMDSVPSDEDINTDEATKSFLVDNICEPYMRGSSYALSFFFGSGKGSGAAMVLFI